MFLLFIKVKDTFMKNIEMYKWDIILSKKINIADTGITNLTEK